MRPICFWQLTDVCIGGMFINLYESLLKGKPVYTLIFIHICKAMLSALTKQFSGEIVISSYSTIGPDCLITIFMCKVDLVKVYNDKQF
jgi:hypothetical protein